MFICHKNIKEQPDSGQGNGLSIAQACDVADKTAFLIGNADLDGGNLMVVAYTDGFCAKQVALFGTRDKHDTVADADCELTFYIHQGSDGQVC